MPVSKISSLATPPSLPAPLLSHHGTQPEGSWLGCRWWWWWCEAEESQAASSGSQQVVGHLAASSLSLLSQWGKKVWVNTGSLQSVVEKGKQSPRVVLRSINKE